MIIDQIAKVFRLGDDVKGVRRRAPRLMGGRGGAGPTPHYAYAIAEVIVEGQPVDITLVVPVSSIKDRLVLGSKVRLRLSVEAATVAPGLRLAWSTNDAGTHAVASVAGWVLTAATHGADMPGWWAAASPAGGLQGDSDGKPTTLGAMKATAEAACAHRLANDPCVAALVADYAAWERRDVEVGQ